jgi:DNA helicase-2/ATP-dependent DNA helicase PcrA
VTTVEDALSRQAEVVGCDSDLFVHACPGAGKTRTVVDRFMRVATEVAPRGVAVLSFTNRASDEVSQRCSRTGHPRLVGFPNFVGTFDRFIATFIVRPFGALGGPIRIVASWDSLDISVPGQGGPPVSLDHFEASADGILRYLPRPLDPVLNQAQTATREWVAAQEWTARRNEGYMSCADARGYAQRLVHDHPEIRSWLRERFAEVIVDEAQDCSEDELRLLEDLRAEGIRIVAVADPNQAIYEWRDAKPTELAAFAANLHAIPMTGNWRSTPAICRAAATMKPGGADDAVGDRATDPTPVHILRYTGHVSPVLGTRFIELVAAAGLGAADGLVVSHGGGPAARAVGAKFKATTGNVKRLAVSAARLVDAGAEPRLRTAALDSIARLLLDFVQVPVSGRTTDHAAEHAGLTQTALLASAVALGQEVSKLSLDLLAPAWVLQARQALTSAAASFHRATKAPGQFLPTPTNSANLTMRTVLGAQPAGVNLAHSTVHGAKGTEAPAVMVVIPPDYGGRTHTAALFDMWENGDVKEPLRVLYVGATRAEKLLVLAVPTPLAARSVALLTAGGVLVSVTDA